MSKTGKIIAWICIVSTLLTGCYTSTLIDVGGKEDQAAYPSDIESVVMKSGTQYHFAAPPALLDEAILLKQATGVTDTLRFDDISYVITRGGARRTLDAVATKDKVLSGPIDCVIMKDGTAYVFERPAAIYRNRVHGALKATAAPGFADDPTAWKQAAKGTMVALPLADVAQVNVSEYDLEATAAVVVGAVVGLVIVTALTWKGPLGGL